MATNNATNTSNPISIAQGGTNAASMSTSTGIVKYDGTSLVTSSAATIDSSNRMKNTSQTAFLAYLGSTVSNVTGNATAFTLGTTTALTEVYDQGSDFNTNGTFTAPVTGRYFLSGTGYLTGCTVNTSCQIQLATSNRTYVNTSVRPASSTDIQAQNGAMTDMDAADTATCVIVGSGEAAATDDVLGSTSMVTFFCGLLEC